MQNKSYYELIFVQEPTAKRIKTEVDEDIVKMETDEVKSIENVDNVVAESSIDEKPDETASPTTPISTQAVTTTKARGGPKGRRGGVARRGTRR